MLQFNKEFNIYSLRKFLSSMITSFKPVYKTCYYAALRQRNVLNYAQNIFIFYVHISTAVDQLISAGWLEFGSQMSQLSAENHCLTCCVTQPCSPGDIFTVLKPPVAAELYRKSARWSRETTFIASTDGIPFTSRRISVHYTTTGHNRLLQIIP